MKVIDKNIFKGQNVIPVALAGIPLDNSLGKKVLLKLGVTKTTQGDYIVDEESYRMISALHENYGIDVVIDYEHQTLSGDKAPAAGWIKEFEFTGEGVVVEPDWTEDAKRMILAGEYRYWSPVIFKRAADNKVMFVHSVGLTNRPATLNIEPLINKMKLEYNPKKENGIMKELIVMLLAWAGTGIDKVSDVFKKLDPEILKLKNSDEQVNAKDLFPFFEKMIAREKQIAESQSGMVALKDIAGILGLAEGAKYSEIKGNIMALKQPSGKFVSVEDFNALQSKLSKREASDLVEIALKEGKITAKQKDWAVGEAGKDPESFKVFLEAQPEIVPLKDRPGYKPPENVPGINVPDEAQVQINKALGISKEDFEKFSKKEK